MHSELIFTCPISYFHFPRNSLGRAASKGTVNHSPYLLASAGTLRAARLDSASPVSKTTAEKKADKHLRRLMCPHLTPVLSTSIYRTALPIALKSCQSRTTFAYENPQGRLCLPLWKGTQSHSTSGAQNKRQSPCPARLKIAQLVILATYGKQN